MKFCPSADVWKDLEELRRQWPGHLVVKGDLHPDDARKTAELGVDRIVVSNHDGKSLDRALASIDSLSAISCAVGDGLSSTAACGAAPISLLLNGWARSSCSSGGPPFAGRCRQIPLHLPRDRILREEIDSTLAFLGCPSFAGLDPRFPADNLRCPGSGIVLMSRPSAFANRPAGA